MTGGLIHLVAYGTQDLFLTGNPQITFFKTVYRRHTNFSIESIKQEFQGTPNFGETLTATILKNGDLINRMYLQIELPRVDLNKTNLDISELLEIARNEVRDITNFNNAFKNYIGVIFSMMRIMKTALQTTNRTLDSIITSINTQYFLKKINDLIDKKIEIQLLEENEKITELKFNSYPNYSNISYLEVPLYTYYKIKLLLAANYYKDKIDTLKDFLTLINSNEDFYSFSFLMQNIDIQSIINFIVKKYLGDILTTEIVKKHDLLNLINKKVIYYANEFNKIFLADKYKKDKKLASLLDNSYVERYKFAWIKQIGHCIIKNISIDIGGNKIDRHTGEWLAIWHELTKNPNQEINYDKMIGNVPELYTFDDKIKDSYILYIPLQFWFCKHYGLSIPLISLNFHDVRLTVELKKIEECCYVEESEISFFNFIGMYNINLKEISLYTDYIYLDSDERKRFAQSSHEYLIDQIQINDFNNVIGKSFNCDLTFNHPCKELIWTCQKNVNLYNIKGTKECKWSDFSYNNKNPIKSVQLNFNSYVRIGRYPGIYYNCVQPYQCHRSIPSAGINLYSFSFFPEEQQPSGTANMSKLDSVKLNLEFEESIVSSLNEDVIDFMEIESGLLINVYAVGYNVLRFMSGMAGLAFSISQ
jgi:hypothetical protein